MFKVKAAQAAMVALAAIGIVAATPTYAAGLDNGTASVYSNQPQYPTGPTIPGGPGNIPALAPDVKVTYVSKTSNNGSMTWTYTVANIGGSTAKGVKLEEVVVRNGFSGSNGITTTTSWETIGDMTAGASKTFVLSCAPKWGEPPCYSSSARAHSTSYDSNSGNDWAVSP